MAKPRKSTRRKSADSTLHNLYVLLKHSFVGKLAFYSMISALLLLAAMIASGNQFDAFFKITGTGLLVITIISWLTYLFTKE
jgi:hypothetical protein